jgi:hypothetical protein
MIIDNFRPEPEQGKILEFFLHCRKLSFYNMQGDNDKAGKESLAGSFL